MDGNQSTQEFEICDVQHSSRWGFLNVGRLKKGVKPILEDKKFVASLVTLANGQDFISVSYDRSCNGFGIKCGYAGKQFQLDENAQMHVSPGFLTVPDALDFFTRDYVAAKPDIDVVVGALRPVMKSGDSAVFILKKKKHRNGPGQRG